MPHPLTTLRRKRILLTAARAYPWHSSRDLAHLHCEGSNAPEKLLNLEAEEQARFLAHDLTYSPQRHIIILAGLMALYAQEAAKCDAKINTETAPRAILGLLHPRLTPCLLGQAGLHPAHVPS